jgi:hypothetical protein
MMEKNFDNYHDRRVDGWIIGIVLLTIIGLAVMLHDGGAVVESSDVPQAQASSMPVGVLEGKDDEQFAALRQASETLRQGPQSAEGEGKKKAAAPKSAAAPDAPYLELRLADEADMPPELPTSNPSENAAQNPVPNPAVRPALRAAQKMDGPASAKAAALTPAGREKLLAIITGD